MFIITTKTFSYDDFRYSIVYLSSSLINFTVIKDQTNRQIVPVPMSPLQFHNPSIKIDQSEFEKEAKRKKKRNASRRRMTRKEMKNNFPAPRAVVDYVLSTQSRAPVVAGFASWNYLLFTPRMTGEWCGGGMVLAPNRCLNSTAIFIFF